MKKKTAMKKSTVSKMEMASNDKNTCSCGGNCMCGSCGSCSCGSWGLMLLRLAVGVFFVMHSILKFSNLSGTISFFQSLGLPGFLAPVTASVEIIAGLLFIVGFWTKWAGYAIAVLMVGAFAFAGLKSGFPAYEVIVTYFAAALAIAWNGPGKWSVHSMCACCNNCNC